MKIIYFFCFFMMVWPTSQLLYAASIEITPLSISLSSASPIASITLINLENKPIIFQTSLLSWTQSKGIDHYTITGDILATPPIFTLLPNQEQVVRVAYLGKNSDSSQEKAYRIYLQEIVPMNRALPSNQVQLAFKIGLPIFLQNSPSTYAEPLWQTKLISKKQFKLSLDNKSSHHMHVLSLSLTDAKHKSLPVDFTPSYVLANTHRTWLLPITSSFYLPLSLTIKTDAGSYSFKLSS